MNDGVPIGIISVTRVRPGTFPRIVQLLQTFADRAVIAIENVRLFDEVQAKTGSNGIAAAADRRRRRPQDHQPLDVRSATGARHAGRDRGALCDTEMAFILRREGDVYRPAPRSPFRRIH
jgi:GAF domain-containing protein